MSNFKSILEETRDGLVEAFNETASDASSRYQRHDMASLAAQILQCEAEAGPNNMTLLSVQRKLFNAFEVSRQLPSERDVTTELSQQVYAFQVQLNRMEKSAEKLLSAEQNPALKLHVPSNFRAQP